MRVLVVDDNATSRSILRHQLVACNIWVKTATGGEQALELLHGAAEAGHAFHLALLDIQMPGMDGWTLARTI